MFPEYILSNNGVTIATAISAIQLKAGANGPIEILRAAITQSSSTTSAQAIVALIRKSTAATVTAAVAGTTLYKANPASAAADAALGTAATGITASAEGINGEQPVQRGFNILTGFEWLPTPEERIIVPPNGVIALTFLAAPASATYYAIIHFRELRGA